MVESTSRDGRVRWLVLLLAAALVAPPAPAQASVHTDNFMRGRFSPMPPRVEFYDYSDGAPAAWTTQGDFTAGTLTGVSATQIPGSLTLTPIGPSGVGLPDPATPWWDQAWNTRHCYGIDHTAPGAVDVTEYQVRLSLDLAGLTGAGLMQADAGDLRAVAADGATQLDLWVEGPPSSAQATVWVQVDSIPGGATTQFCLYYGYRAGTASPLPNHTEAAVFTHSERKPIYYAVSERYASNPSTLAVVSLVDGNSVQRDAGPPTALATAGRRTTFNAAGTSPASVFSVLGPITSRGTGNAYDTLVPISWAGTSFAVPTSRATQRFSFYAPFADAAVSIYNGGAGAPYASFVVPRGTQYTHAAGDVTGNNSTVIESSTPVLVTHVTTNGRDAVAVHPAGADRWYGVRSQNARIGFTHNGTGLTVRRSDGSTQIYTNNRGQTRAIGGGGNQGGGAADGFLLIPDEAIGALSQADSDGLESAVFLPEDELNAEYWIPTNSQYVAFSCPDPGFPITLTPPSGAPRTVTCSGSGGAGFPGWAKDTANLNVTGARGIRVHSPGGEPFYSYYEDRANNDETNLLGMKQGRQYTWPEPVLTENIEGLVVGPGTWESATFDTGAGTGIFGQLASTGVLPTGTSLRFQVATSDVDPPTVFVGPDGTGASYFSGTPDALAFANDGDRYLRVKAVLDTAYPYLSPELQDVSVDHHLQHLAHPLAGSGTITVAGTVGDTSKHFLIRVRSEDAALAGSLAHLRYVTGSGLGNVAAADLGFENAPSGFTSTQLSINGGPPDPATGPLVGFDPARPHSIVLTEQMLPGGAAIGLRWRVYTGGGTSPFIDHDLTVTISS